MLANWIHIVIVHFAVIGTPLLLFKILSQRKLDMDSRQWRNNFIFSMVLGVFAGTAYFTGPEAANWIKGVIDNYSQDLVEDHGFWARVAFVIQILGALIGIMGFSSILQDEKPDRRISIVLMFLLAINTGVMFYTAHLGGLIRRIDLM